MRERREAPRLTLRARFRADVVSDEPEKASNGDHCAGWTSDVSFGGLHLSSRRSLPLHSMIDLEVSCTHPAESLTIRGRVGWVREEADKMHAIGVFLDAAEKSDLVAWRRMLDRRGIS
jgi:hypothetical protein